MCKVRTLTESSFTFEFYIGNDRNLKVSCFLMYYGCVEQVIFIAGAIVLYKLEVAGRAKNDKNFDHTHTNHVNL